ncbi:MAG: hypothetical protein CMJ84_10530 [Planctomycetes bacterium]|nr:hypothetical protein [Planctomycetota bacterium]
MTETELPQDSGPTPSRRDFLGKAAAVAGAGALLGACASTPEKPPIPKAEARTPVGEGEPLRIGVVGPGGMGTGHIDRITHLAGQGKEQVEIVALSDVCSTRYERAQQILTERQGGPADTHDRYEDLVARDDLHGVLVATTEHWHGKIAEDAILAGKDVYCEKPMTLDLGQALRLREVSLANPQAILQVGTQYIAQEKYRKAKELIAQGAIGKPTFSQTSYCRNSKDGEWLYYAIDPRWEPGVNLDWERWLGDRPAAEWDPEVYARWRRYKTYSTGIIGDLLVHVMTPLVMAVDQGWPTRVTASGGHYVDQVMENHDQVNLTIEFEDGHTMIVAGSTCNEIGLETIIRGHEATMYLGSKDVVVRPERHWVDEIDEQRISCPSISDQDELRLNWLKCIRTREPNWSPVDLGTKVMVIVDLASRSMWEGHAFGFDPATMSAYKI